MSARSIIRRSASTAVVLVLAGAAPAWAAGHAGVVAPADVLGIGHLVGSVFGSIGQAVLGAFSWTFQLAENFLLTTVGAIVKLLIPRSWAREGVQIMGWIVQIPDYAGTITSPTGQHSYGFAGINALRDLFTWIGAALLPLTLVYATSRAAIGHGDPVAVPIIRVLGLGALLLSYPYWWSQAAAVINQMTYLVLSLSPVVSGLHKLMLYAVDGAVLGGWQLIDLSLMAAVAIQLLALIFLKVAIILLGALLYATGPVTIGLIPTDAGAAITRAWASAVGALLLLPVAWAAVFAVGALLINDAGTAGPLIGGHSDIGSLLGGVLVAVAGLASLWLCLRAAREAGGLLRVQVGGLLAVAHSRGSSTSTAAGGAGARSPSAAQSIRGFQSRVSEARGAAVGALVSSGTTGARVARAGGVAAGLGRRGALGSAAMPARGGAAYGAPVAAGLIGRSRAGAVAVQMARAGTASWQSTAARNRPSNGGGPAVAGATNAASNAASTARASSAPSPPPGAASSGSAAAPASASAGALSRPPASASPAPGPSATRPASSPSSAPATAASRASSKAKPPPPRPARAFSPPRQNPPGKNPPSRKKR